MCTILHSCGFASSIVSKEGGDLSLIESQGQPVHGQFVSMAVDLHEILNVNTWLYVAWLFLNADSCKSDTKKQHNLSWYAIQTLSSLK